MYLQRVDAVGWNPGRQYQMNGVIWCYSMTVTATGEMVVWVKTENETWEARWYDTRKKLIHTLPTPPQCGRRFRGLSVLAIEVGGKEQVVSCSPYDQCIWLGSLGTKTWSVAWQANGEEGSEERKGQPTPYRMCQGKPGQIFAYNWRNYMQEDETNVSVFDITQIPFRLVVPEIKLGMHVWDLSYCELPGVGGALAVTDGNDGYKLCMFSLDSGALLWSLGGKNERRRPVKVAGAEWWPDGVCSDNRGRLYVADNNNNRIIVLSAASGLVLQEIKHQYLEQPDYLCWDEQTKSIIVGTENTCKISYFKIAF